jgi:tetratricopeptide (TPR) repeat protein
MIGCAGFVQSSFRGDAIRKGVAMKTFGLLAALVLSLGTARAGTAPGQFQKAAGLSMRGDYEGAVREYRAYLEAEPSGRLAPAAEMAVANIRLRVLRDTTAAQESLDRVLADYPRSPWASEAAREKGACARARGDWAEAAVRYRLAVELAASTRGAQSDTWVNETAAAAADCFYRADDRAKAAETYEGLLAGSPSPEVAATALFRLGETQEADGKEKAAAASYVRLLESYPSSALFDAAVAKREIIDKHATVRWEPYLAYAEGTQMIGRRDLPGARAKCEEILSGPAPEALRECAEYRKITLETSIDGDFTKGVRLLGEFLDKHPDGLRTELAQQTLDQQWRPAAELERRFRESPDDPEVLARLGGTYLQAGASARAVETLGKAAALDPDNERLHLQLGYAHLRAGSPDSALKEFAFYLEKNPRDANTLNQIGYVCLGQGDAENAIRYFQRYVDVAPEDPNAHDSMGEGLLGAGRLEEAAREYEKAVSLDPTFANSHFMLGRVYAEMKRNDRAVEAYGRFLDLAPAGAQADQARAAIQELGGN